LSLFCVVFCPRCSMVLVEVSSIIDWKFPECQDEHAERATFEFRLNCHASPKLQ
jgi:hypothetical protein